MMENVVTVDYLLNLLQKLHNAGKGTMQIKCIDNLLHEDEISIDYINNEMEFQGFLFNLPIVQKVRDFCIDIEKAEKKFYGAIESEE